MFMSNSYLNINLKNTNIKDLKQSKTLPIRNVKNLQNVFDLKSSSASGASRLFISKSRQFYCSHSERNGMSSINWKKVQETHKNKFSWVNFSVLHNFSREASEVPYLNFQNCYHFLFLSRLWLFDVLLNSISQKFNQTLLFQKFSNILIFHETEKIPFIHSQTRSSFSLNTSQYCFEKNFSISQLSHFSQKKSLLFKNGNFIKQDQSSLFFMEFYQYFLKTNSKSDVKVWRILDCVLSNELFFKAHKFLNFFLLTLGLETLDFQSSVNKKKEKFSTRFLQNSIIKSKSTKGNFFVFKEIFYLFAYGLFHEFYIKDSNAQVFPLNSNPSKIWRNRDLNFLFLSQTNPAEVLGKLKDISTPSFFNTSTNKYDLLQSNLNSTIKDPCLEKDLRKSTLSKNFSLNKTNLIINKMFLDNLRFVWLDVNLKLTFKHTNMHPYFYHRKIRKSLFMNSFYISRKSPFFITSVLYLLQGHKDNIQLKKVLKTKYWTSINSQLFEYGQKFRKKPLLSFWTYFFTNSDLFTLILSEKDFHFQNIPQVRAELNGWVLNSLTFLNFSNTKPKEKHLHQIFLNLNLVSKNKVKQKVVSYFLNQQRFRHSLLRDFKNRVKNSGSLTQSDLILKLTSLLYIYSYSFFNELDFNSVRLLDKEIFNCLWKWACRRHNNKSKKWIRCKYFSRLTPTLWVFGCSEDSLEFQLKNKVLANSPDGMNFLYLPRLSQVVFHLTRSLNKKLE